MMEAIDRDPDRWSYGPAWGQHMIKWAGECKRLIVPSQTELERASRLLFLGEERFAIVPAGYDSVRFAPHAGDRPAVLPQTLMDRGDADLLLVLFTRPFTTAAGVPLLIEAYERARPGFTCRATLLIAGKGESENAPLRDVVARLDARDVLFTEMPDRGELPGLFASAEVLVHPDSGDLGLLEGMACGLPAVALDTGTAADIVLHGETGWLVEPDDVAGLANALIEAVNRPDERRRRGANAAKDVARRFVLSEVVGAIAAIYEEVSETAFART